MPFTDLGHWSFYLCVVTSDGQQLSMHHLLYLETKPATCAHEAYAIILSLKLVQEELA